MSGVSCQWLSIRLLCQPPKSRLRLHESRYRAHATHRLQHRLRTDRRAITSMPDDCLQNQRRTGMCGVQITLRFVLCRLSEKQRVAHPQRSRVRISFSRRRAGAGKGTHQAAIHLHREELHPL